MTPAETAAQLRLAAEWIEKNMPEQPKPAELTPELAAKGYEQYGFGPAITVVEQPDPYAELKKAHVEGKVIQFFSKTSGWYDCNKLNPPKWTSPPERYRIKPDEILWIEWHGGKCPLKDDEVEEWEVRYSNNDTGIFTMPPSNGAGWIGDDIYKAYRVLKWREKKPKVALGPEDVRCGDELLMASKRYGILTVTDSSVEYLAASGPVQVTFEWLQKNGVTIRRRNSDAWEACEK